jgi:hypothetical protein
MAPLSDRPLSNRYVGITMDNITMEGVLRVAGRVRFGRAGGALMADFIQRPNEK